VAGAGAGEQAEPEPPAATSGRRDRLLFAVVALAAVVVSANAIATGALRLDDYPVEVVATAERMGVLAPGRLVATQDTVGCYLILHRGRAAGVFIDDRYDMYPLDVSLDYVALLRTSPGAVEILDRRRVDAVLWDRSLPLVAALRERGWRETAGDRRWVLLQRP